MPVKAISAQVKGLDAVTKKIRESGLKGQRAFSGALYAEALHVMEDSVKRTPLVTSRLRNSHFVTVPTPGKYSEVRLGYGVKYAYRVHEGIKTRTHNLKLKDMPRRAQAFFWAHVTVSSRSGGMIIDLPEPKRSSQGGPHFLRNAINAAKAGQLDRIARTTERYFEAGQGIKLSPGMPRSEEAGRSKADKMSRGKKDKV